MTIITFPVQKRNSEKNFLHLLNCHSLIMVSINGKLLWLLTATLALLFLKSVYGEFSGGVIEADKGSVEYNAKIHQLSKGAKLSDLHSCDGIVHVKSLNGCPISVMFKDIPVGGKVSLYREPTENTVNQAMVYDNTQAGQTINWDENSMTMKLTQNCTDDNKFTMSWETNCDQQPTSDKIQAFGYLDSPDGTVTWSGERNVDKKVVFIVPGSPDNTPKQVTVDMVYNGDPQNWWDPWPCTHTLSMAQLHEDAMRTICCLSCRSATFTTTMTNVPLYISGTNYAGSGAISKSGIPSDFTVEWKEV